MCLDTQTPEPPKSEEEKDQEDDLRGAKSVVPIRVTTGFPGVDRVLGGGLVVWPPCVVQLGAPQGSGKSTLLMQISNNLATNCDVLYASSEETKDAMAILAHRIGVTNFDRLKVVCTKSLDVMRERVERYKPLVFINDSLQKTHLGPPVEAGKRPKRSQYATLEVLSDIIEFTHKQPRMATFIVNHMNKEGGMAGLNELSHDVDVVAMFEGSGGSSRSPFRRLSLQKNRRGATTEEALFRMTAHGLVEGPADDEEDDSIVRVNATTGLLRSRMVDKKRGRQVRERR